MNANQLNAALRKAGLRVRLCRGDGYYYWLDARDMSLAVWAASVYVAQASSLSLDHWLSLAREAEATLDVA